MFSTTEEHEAVLYLNSCELIGICSQVHYKYFSSQQINKARKIPIKVGTHQATSCSNTSRRQITPCVENFCENLCPRDRILSLQQVAKNQIRLNLCDLLRRQNSVAATKIFTKLSTTHEAICRCNVSPCVPTLKQCSPQSKPPLSALRWATQETLSHWIGELTESNEEIFLRRWGTI